MGAIASLFMYAIILGVIAGLSYLVIKKAIKDITRIRFKK